MLVGDLLVLFVVDYGEFLVFNADVVLNYSVELLNLPSCEVLRFLTYFFTLSKTWWHLEARLANVVHFEVEAGDF